jgi:hypothetical protein
MEEYKGGPPPPHLPDDHVVVVRVEPGGILRYDKCCVHAMPGDTISWHLDGARAWSVIVKAFEGPLGWGHWVAAKGERSIRAIVRPDAKPGFYPYTLVAVDGERLLVADPEIIIPPPHGGRGG